MELNKEIEALKEMAETFKKHGNLPVDGEMLELTIKTIILVVETIDDELKEIRKVTKK